MNKSIISILAFVSFTLVAFGQPKFTIVGGDEYNWGDVTPKASPLKASIALKNEGSEVLIIQSVKPGCGCSAAKPNKDTLAPGESSTMDVEFNISNYTGVTSKSIAIETNDPNRSKVFFRITANVNRAIIIKPGPYMPFKELKVGEESASTVYIKNNSNADIVFSDLKVEPPIIKLTIPTTFTLKPDQEIEITGRMLAKEAGYHSSKILLKTNHPDYPTFEIPAYGHAADSPIFNNPEKK